MGSCFSNLGKGPAPAPVPAAPPAQGPSFSSLPADVLERVAACLDPKDIASLRKTCIACAGVGEERVLPLMLEHALVKQAAPLFRQALEEAAVLGDAAAAAFVKGSQGGGRRHRRRFRSANAAFGAAEAALVAAAAGQQGWEKLPAAGSSMAEQLPTAMQDPPPGQPPVLLVEPVGLDPAYLDTWDTVQTCTYRKFVALPGLVRRETGERVAAVRLPLDAEVELTHSPDDGNTATATLAALKAGGSAALYVLTPLGCPSSNAGGSHVGVAATSLWGEEYLQGPVPDIRPLLPPGLALPRRAALLALHAAVQSQFCFLDPAAHSDSAESDAEVVSDGSGDDI